MDTEREHRRRGRAMNAAVRLSSAVLAGLLAGCGGREQARPLGPGPFDASAYRTIRVAHLDESLERDWAEIPAADPQDDGRFVEVQLSTFATEELLSGASAAMRTLASRILHEDGKGLRRYFAPGFQGPAVRPGGAMERLGRVEFLASLREYLKGFDRLRDVRFKEVRVERRAEDGLELALDLKLTLLGSRGGALRKVVMRFPAEMAPVEGYWRFTRWGALDLREEEGNELYFISRTKDVGFKPYFDDRVRVPGGQIGGLLYVNGGLAVEDVDGDGDLDVYVTRYGPNFLYVNDGLGRFRDQAQGRGVADEGHGHGAVFCELDGDGDLDLFLANHAGTLPDHPSRVYWNEGGRWRSELPGGLAVSDYATAVAVADPDLDGDLDIYLGRYGNVLEDHSYSAARNAPRDLYFRNDQARRFTEASSAVGIDNTGWTLAAAWADYDSDGDPDLYIANDFGVNELYQNRGNGTFEEVAAELGVADLGNGMGANWVDFDRDGDLDLYSVNMYSTAGNRVLEAQLADLSEDRLKALKKMAGGNTMLRNDGDRFVDVSAETGCKNAGWAWGAEFFDADFDGDLDLFVANGYWSSTRQRDL